MAKPKKQHNEEILSELVQETLKLTDPKHPVNEQLPSEKEFTGQALAVLCYNTNGIFKNFKIAKLSIEQGEVTKIEYGNPFASFEAGSFVNIVCDRSLIRLNNTWSAGKAWSLVDVDGKF